MEVCTALLPSYDPQVLIQSPTTGWVARRGLADRALWTAIAASAQNICADMIRVDEINAQLETGKLLLQRRDQGYYADLHHPFHDHPCLPAVGNYPLSVMGALLSPGLEHEFRSTETFGTAMEAIAFDWSRTQGMEAHVELMAGAAKLVSPFLTMGGQGTVVNSEFMWQRGRDQMMEFLQAATCADELEELWRRMNDDDEAEVDPSGYVLESLGQEESVLEQGNGEVPSSSGSGRNVVNDAEAAGKAPEISPEVETADGSTRRSTTRFFLQRMYESVYDKLFADPPLQDRQTGRTFDSTKGYPGEGPLKDGLNIPTQGMPWISEDHLDRVVAKKWDQSSDQGEGGSLESEGESQPKSVQVENASTKKVLRALWRKGYRAGYGRLCRVNGIGLKNGTVKVPIRAARRPGSEMLFLKKPLIRGSAQHGSGADGKIFTKVIKTRPGFPAVPDMPRTTSALGEKDSSQVLGNVQVEQSRPMDRYDAERQAKRQKGFCYWFSRGKNNCRFGEDCKFIHSEDDVALPAYWCKYYVAGRVCHAGPECKFSHDAAGVRCIQFYQTGMCRRGDGCVFEHGETLGETRPRSPRTPPRDRQRRSDGGEYGERRCSPERLEEEDLMVYDDDTRRMELLMEAVSYMSGGKPDLAFAEAEPVFKLIKFEGDEELRSAEWCSWTTGMLTPLELHEVVKSFEVSLDEVEEWTSDLRIWYDKANLDEGGTSKKGRKRSLEGDFIEDAPEKEAVPETSETRVNVDEELKKTKKRKKPAATEDPYTLLVPRPKKRPANVDKSGSSSKAVVSGEEKPSSKARTKSGGSGKSRKKEKSQSPGKKEVSVVEGSEEKDCPSEKGAQASAVAEAGPEQACSAVEEAKREGMISSIQRSVMDPILTVWDLEQILIRLRLSIDANRAKAKE